MKTLFLHRNMRSINQSINSAIDSLYSSNEIHATLPFKLHGSTTNQRGLIDRLINKRNRNPELIIGSGIGLDPMELLAEFAVSHDFDFFEFDPILDIKMASGNILLLLQLNYIKRFIKKLLTLVVSMLNLFVFNML